MAAVGMVVAVSENVTLLSAAVAAHAHSGD
jgi:hypothetical protein